MNDDRDDGVWVKTLVQALQDGTVLDLAPGEDVDVSQAASWPAPRRLPGEALRAALIKQDVKADPRGLNIRAAYIIGITDLADLRLSFGLHLDSCAFEKFADWSRLTVGSLRLAKCTTSGLALTNAHIAGGLVLRNATLTNDGGWALDLVGADVKGTVSLEGLTATGEVSAFRASIGGQLDLADATLTNDGGRALDLAGADIKASVFVDGLTATGEVDAAHTSIGGNLLGTATLTNDGGRALDLIGADVKGTISLGRSTATGEVRATGTTIKGQLDLADATLTNDGGRALDLTSAEIGDVVLMGLTVNGEVSAGSTGASQINLTDATLTNNGGIALSLDHADVKGSVFLDGLTATGEVRALGATIGGGLLLHRASLTNEGAGALLLGSARLNDVVLKPALVKGRISFSRTQITTLSTPFGTDAMDVLIDSPLSASGWRLGDIRGRIRHDKKAAADWLSRDKASGFVPQPWHELANVYERNGQPAAARWMRLKAARAVTRNSPWRSKPVRWIYDALTGHGYYPLRAAVWLILAIVASGIIVYTNAAVFTPTAANKVAWKTSPPVAEPAPPITGATPCDDLQDQSTCLRPFLYGFDNALPGTLATGQAAQWTANGAQGFDNWIPWTLGGLKIASWIFVALLLAGVTGLLRKT